MSKSWIGSVWKPKGVSSFKMLGGVKNYFETRKVGHMGTLDPLAEGVLPIAVGKYTKLISYVNLLPKEYIAEITFGVSSETLDAEGVSEEDLREVRGGELDFSAEEIVECLDKMIGFIDQVPPIFSALKIDGKRAYKLAREGGKVEMKPRKVECFELVLDRFWNDEGLWKCKVKVSCGKGYYVRSMVRDLCDALGVEGFMSGLVREKVGGFTREKSFGLDEECPGEVDWKIVLDGNQLIEISKENWEEFRNGRMVGYDGSVEDECIAMYEGEPVSILKSYEREGRTYLRVKKNI